jgi:hypothetical protein
MSRWFRHYAGMMRDDKLVSAAVRCKQPVERVVWIWGAILESAAEVNDNGKFALDTAEAAYFLRADQAELDSIVGALEGMGRICDGRVVKWGDRQFASDRSADRTRAYRERQEKQQDSVDQNVTETVSDDVVTSQSRHGDAPETDTEIETERKKDTRAVAIATRPAIDDEFQKFWAAYPKRDGANPKSPARKAYLSALKSGTEAPAILAGAGEYGRRERERIGTPYIAQAVTWLRQRRWEDYAVGPPDAAQSAWRPGLPTSAELEARYGDEGARSALESNPSVGESGLRFRGAEPGMVRREGGKHGTRSLGSVLQKTGLGSDELQGAFDSEAGRSDSGMDCAVPMARMVHG